MVTVVQSSGLSVYIEHSATVDYAFRCTTLSRDASSDWLPLHKQRAASSPMNIPATSSSSARRRQNSFCGQLLLDEPTRTHARTDGRRTEERPLLAAGLRVDWTHMQHGPVKSIVYFSDRQRLSETTPRLVGDVDRM